LYNDVLIIKQDLRKLFSGINSKKIRHACYVCGITTMLAEAVFTRIAMA